MKKRIILIICLGFAFHANCQMKVSFDNNCINYNSALISKVMINILGLNTVSNQLENKNNIIFVIDVDSLGNLVEIKRIHSKKNYQKIFERQLKIICLLEK
jgi:hypothetical protein